MIHKILLALTFFTRLPLGKRDFGALTLAQSVAYFPVAGAIIGALSGGVYIACVHFGIANNIAAWLTIIFSIILTGGLHEDGLADSADGLASGRDKEQKLAIMRDSRIGSYGVLALIAIISLRANIIDGFNGNLKTLFIFIATAANSRALLALFMLTAANARADGLAVNSGKPELNDVLLAILMALFTIMVTGKLFTALLAILALVIIYVIIKHIALKNFGGITGDVLGATQQISEVSLLLIFLIYNA